MHEWWINISTLQERMKTDGNGRENHSAISVSFFITENGSGSGIVEYQNGNGGYGNRREPKNLPECIII